MLRRTYTMILAVTLLFAAISFSQTYQGPAVGTVNSGVVVNTDDFLSRPVENFNILDRIINTEFIQDPIYVDGDNKFLDNYLYVEDKNAYGEMGGGIGTSFKLTDVKVFSMSEGAGIPPDPHLAVGPDHVIAVINSRFKIFDKSGNLLKSIVADNFFSTLLPNAGTFDPQVIYDHYENRWFMLWDNVDDIAFTSFFLIAYSDDSDPLGTWYLYALPSNRNGSTPTQDWGDYPQLGYDDQAIYVTSRQFNFSSGYAGGKLRILNKNQLYSANSGPVSWTDLWNIRYLNGQSSDDLHPIVSYDAGLNTGYIMMIPNGGNFYAVYKISDPISNPVLTGYNLLVSAFEDAPGANQLGGGTPLLDTGIGGSGLRCAPILRDGSLYGVHHINNSQDSGYVSIRYFSIDLNTNTLLDEVELGAQGYYYFYPTIAVDQEHNVAITYTRSGDDEYAGSYYSTRLSTDPPGLSPSKIMMEGKGNYRVTYSGTRNRWGDYLGAALDPSNQTNIWLLSEYAAATNEFGVWLSEIRMKPLQGVYGFLPFKDFDFGTTEIQTDSDTIDVIITNYGVDPLIINSIPESQADFYRVSDLTFPVTLNTYDTLIVNMVFIPTTSGSQSTFYPIDCNSDSISGFNLTGFGYEMFPAVNQILYGISGLTNSGNTLYINTATGVGTNLGESNYTNFLGMAIHPETNLIYGVISNAFGSEIYRINAQLGDAYLLVSLKTPNLYSIAFDNNAELYGTSTTGEISKINLETGEVSLVSLTPIFPIAITFNPNNNELWGSFRKGFGSPKDLLVKIDLPTGDTTNIGQTGFAVNTVDIEFDENGILYGVKGSGTNVSDLFSIDTLTGVGTLIGSTGIKDIKALGFSLGNITSVHENSEVKIPLEYVLEQNYPNPFNPSTQIKFALPFNSSVRITIYNLLGEVVRELVNTDMNSGVHTVQWNGEDISGRKVSSGIYFYELNAHGVNGNQFNQVRKMILMK